MSQSESTKTSQEVAIAEAKSLLAQVIALAASSGRHVSAAHAQMALDSLDTDSSRLDPQLPA
jgi:hypothetical protein